MGQLNDLKSKSLVTEQRENQLHAIPDRCPLSQKGDPSVAPGEVTWAYTCTYLEGLVVDKWQVTQIHVSLLELCRRADQESMHWASP